MGGVYALRNSKIIILWNTINKNKNKNYDKNNNK